ncbi:hypothetical protein AB0L06_27940 [Spirillospora sp. NPDC052269]
MAIKRLLRVWGPAVIVLAVAYYLRRRPATLGRRQRPPEDKRLSLS